MAYTPTTRKPTGIPAAPLIMVSGLPKSGKSMASYKLGLSPRIEHCWVIDLGEGSADEYGALGCYDVLDWGRTFADLQDTIRWCVEQPVSDGMLNAVVLDSGTELWDNLKIRADRRARSSKKNAQALRDDPDYEVDVSMPFWNDAKEVWARCISPMRLAGHLVGVVVVRSEVVAEVVNGAPTKNKVTSYQCEKTLPAAVTAHVSIAPDHSARLIQVRSMEVSVDRKGIGLNGDNPLGHLLDILSPERGFSAPTVTAPIDEERLLSPEQRKMIVDLVMSVTDASMRAAVKKRLGDQWGQTTTITRDQFDACVIWLTRMIESVQGEQQPVTDDLADDPPAADPDAAVDATFVEVDPDDEGPY